MLIYYLYETIVAQGLTFCKVLWRWSTSQAKTNPGFEFQSRLFIFLKRYFQQPRHDSEFLKLNNSIWKMILKLLNQSRTKEIIFQYFNWKNDFLEFHSLLQREIFDRIPFYPLIIIYLQLNKSDSSKIK